MAEPQQDVFPEVARLPTVGTPARREWDLTIRQANELYPDWSSISVGKARFGRETYEKQYKGYCTETGHRKGRGQARARTLAARAFSHTASDGTARPGESGRERGHPLLGGEKHFPCPVPVGCP